MLAGEKVDVRENFRVPAPEKITKPSKQSTKSRFSLYRSNKAPDKPGKKLLKSLAIPVHKVAFAHIYSPL